jgi:hypothetical protein
MFPPNPFQSTFSQYYGHVSDLCCIANLQHKYRYAAPRAPEDAGSVLVSITEWLWLKTPCFRLTVNAQLDESSSSLRVGPLCHQNQLIAVSWRRSIKSPAQPGTHNGWSALLFLPQFYFMHLTWAIYVVAAMCVRSLAFPIDPRVRIYALVAALLI